MLHSSVALRVCYCHYDGYSCVFQQLCLSISFRGYRRHSQSNSHQSGLQYRWLLHYIRPLTLRLDIGEMILSANPDGKWLRIKYSLMGTTFCESLFYFSNSWKCSRQKQVDFCYS